MITVERYCDICDCRIKGGHYKIRSILYKNHWKPMWVDICERCMDEVGRKVNENNNNDSQSSE